MMTPGSVVKPDIGNRRGVGVLAFLLALVTAGALAHVAVRMHGAAPEAFRVLALRFDRGV